MPRAPSRWSNVDNLLGFGRHGHRRADRVNEEEQALLANYHGPVDFAIAPKEVTKVCLRLRHLVQEVVPCEIDASLITSPHSRIITPAVIKAAKDAGGEQYKGCVVYCLLVNLSWFQREALIELWDAGLHKMRAEACGVIAKLIIEGEEDTSYLLHSVLLHRYSHLVRGVPVHATNVVEKAVDLHAVRVIGSSGYQKCIGYLWRGWVVQSEEDPSFFVDYTDKDNSGFVVHMDPRRMRTPRNQNAAQLLFSLVYLGLYTLAINTVNPTGVFDFGEILLYVFTLGFICDELLKVYKVGYRILGFWNVFNGVLYTFLTVSLAFRIVGLSFNDNTVGREHYSLLSYNMLAFIAPMFWCRLLLYLDSFNFFGTMLVVLKVMLKESVIFFALLAFIIIGFLQAFIGLDLAEDNRSTDTSTVIQYMVKVVLSSPELDGFDTFSAPWGTILYYCYTFIVMTILLNILIALYNSAYSDILENADDEYLALFAHRTMQFVRAPDENVYIAPLNLIEILISASCEWWMSKKMYETVNDCVMTVLYSPLLVITALFEMRTANAIRRNRARGEEDDDVVDEWEQLEREVDFVAEGWTKTCDAVKPNLVDDPVVLQMKVLRAEIEGLKTLLAEMGDSINLVTSQDTKFADDLIVEPDYAAAPANATTEEAAPEPLIEVEPAEVTEDVVPAPAPAPAPAPEPASAPAPAPMPEPLEEAQPAAPETHHAANPQSTAPSYESTSPSAETTPQFNMPESPEVLLFPNPQEQQQQSETKAAAAAAAAATQPAQDNKTEEEQGPGGDAKVEEADDSKQVKGKKKRKNSKKSKDNSQAGPSGSGGGQPS